MILIAAQPVVGRGPLPTYDNRQVVLQRPGDAYLDRFALGDFNCDGRLDVVIARALYTTPQTFTLVILLNQGDGTFVDGTATVFVGDPPRTQHPRRIVVADFNGDGRDDVFVADHGQDSSPFSGYQNQLALSTPDCKLVNATANLPQQSDFTHALAVADIDGDGALDLYIGNLWFGTNIHPQIWRNDGAGRFTIAPGRLPAAQTDVQANQYASARFVDVNGDGSPDLVLGGSGDPNGDNPSVILFNDGTGHFPGPAVPLPPKPFQPGIAVDIQAADLNGDGHPDLLISFTKGNPFYEGRWLQILINDGAGGFTDETATRLPQTTNALAWAENIEVLDIDGDGAIDIALRLSGPKALDEDAPFYLNDGSGVFTRVTVSVGRLWNRLWLPLSLNSGGRRDFFTAVGGTPTEFYAIVRDTGLALLPGIPQEVTATRGVSTSRVRVTWHHVWGATAYEVWRSPSAGSAGALVKTTSALLYDDVPSGGGTYFYSVRATNPAGSSVPSVQVPGWTNAIFADVPGTHPFFQWIEALFGAGITGGCNTGPLQYCPDTEVTRAQMAVFLLRGIHGAGYQPPAATGTMFMDVPVGQPFAKWIEQLAREGITGGCGGGDYCPDAAVTRGQMAVFLVRAFNLPM